jgi:hypothetical protein
MPTPDLLFWNRIEPHPRSENIEEALKATVRDPLWMLSRQWQLGEFQGEDAGKATSIQLNYQKYLPKEVIDRQENRMLFDGSDQPLESVVENMACQPDLFARIEIGRQWFRFLEKDLNNNKEELIQSFQESEILQFRMPPQTAPQQQLEQADLLSNKPYLDILEILVKEQKIDGGILLHLIADEDIRFSEQILGEVNAEIDAIGERLLEWAGKIYSIHIGKNPFWSNEQLEYQFDLSIDLSANSEEILSAEEYFGDDLDWYQFDKAPQNSLFTTAETVNNAGSEPITVHLNYPGDVKYQGMPNARWWELEDSAVNFGNIKADPTSPATLVFTQFNLMYSNDWLMMPLEMQRGTLNKITEMVVTDNFGIRTLVKHIHEKTPNELWGLFQLHNPELGIGEQNDSCLLIPAVIDDLQKSKPIEEINFLRDEMANMVWAVEHIVPNGLGEGTPGDETAEAVQRYLSTITASPNQENFINEAKVQYQLSSTVPENWIPFIPVHLKNQQLISREIQLQRAALPRIVNGFAPVRIRPKTTLLSQGLDTKNRSPFHIYEEEVPRSGIMVKGQWKRVRWLNGKTIIWYAYEKRNGRGNGNSGLKFDTVIPI